MDKWRSVTAEAGGPRLSTSMVSWLELLSALFMLRFSGWGQSSVVELGSWKVDPELLWWESWETDPGDRMEPVLDSRSLWRSPALQFPEPLG